MPPLPAPPLHHPAAGDFGDLGDDEEYEVEIYEDEDGSFYYIDPDTGEEVPCDEDGNAL